MILFAILEWRNENIFMGHQSLKLDKPDSYLIVLKIIKGSMVKVGYLN